MCARVINGYGEVLHTVIAKNGYVKEEGFIGRAKTALWCFIGSQSRSIIGIALLFNYYIEELLLKRIL